MDAARWKTIKDTFAEVVELSPALRAQQLTGKDPELRTAVEDLLAAHESANDFIEQPFLVENGLALNDLDESIIGTQLDGYRIVEKIGTGGMGAVYLAERTDSDFSQKAALKLIKRGMDTNAVLKRFIVERQILANLEHPNIARLIDGGATENGLPYFVMEYVEGDDIRKFCGDHGLETRKRLELFSKVCAAVSYAHQKLIVHRDLKPSNIIVTKDGEPKLLDFGIAKFLSPDWHADTAEATATNFRIMTPEYASPEQLRGEPTTTATDVYSLGVVLYELMTGTRPFRFGGKTPVEIAEAAVTQEPLRPSAAAGSSEVLASSPQAKKTTHRIVERRTSTQPHNSASRIGNPKSLRGDLDNIILKAIRREPERRYQSVQEFSEDIHRYLTGLPVRATGDTRSYRIGKFVQRHRAAVLVAALAAIVLLAATGVTAWQYTVARRERARAEERFDQVRQLANTVLFDYHDKIRELPGTIELRKKIVNDALIYLDNLQKNSDGDVELERDLVKAYQKVGEVQFGLVGGNLGDSGGALDSFHKAVAAAEKLAAEENSTVEDRLLLADSYSSLAGITGETGDIHGDIELKNKAIAIYEALAAEDPTNLKLQANVARSSVYLAMPLAIVGEEEKAVETLQRAAVLYHELAQKEPETAEKHYRNEAVTYNYLSRTLTRLGRFDEALAAGLQSLEINRKAADAAPDNSNTQFDFSASYYSIGICHLESENTAAAREALENSLNIRTKLLDADPQNAFFRDNKADATFQIGVAQTQSEEFQKAVETLETAIGLMEISIKADPADVFNQIRLAQYKSALGYVRFRSAFGERRLEARKAELMAAEVGLRESAQIWTKLRDRNAVPKFNEIEAARNESRIVDCERELAKLR